MPNRLGRFGVPEFATLTTGVADLCQSWLEVEVSQHKSATFVVKVANLGTPNLANLLGLLA